MSKKNKTNIGYTSGVYDLFHIGPIHLLKNAKAICDILIVACSIDAVVQTMKNKIPVIPYLERIEISNAISYVNIVVCQEEEDYVDKINAWNKYKFDTIFFGSD